MNAVTILVVEDEAIVRKDIVNTLEAMHYSPLYTAGSGDEAIASAREHAPDVVLMDINIPGTMDGLEAAGIISRDMEIPVIFATAYADDAILEKAKNTNPYGYVIKPFSGRDIKAAIEVALSRKAAEKKRTETATSR
ncbi:MAG: response regulator [Methanoregula sp.]|jgi:CheY-like chemotaxis protein|nr:response regulator [Methanoregula sp.]